MARRITTEHRDPPVILSGADREGSQHAQPLLSKLGLDRSRRDLLLHSFLRRSEDKEDARRWLHFAVCSPRYSIRYLVADSSSLPDVTVASGMRVGLRAGSSWWPCCFVTWPKRNLCGRSNTDCARPKES